MMKLAVIAACTPDRIIGHRGKIPWHSPKDLQYFKKMTESAILIMGRKTLESLPGLLAKRIHLVITSKADELRKSAWYQSQLTKRSTEELNQKIQLVTSVDDALKKSEELLELNSDLQSTVYVAGGGQIYEQMLPKCSIVYLTFVETPDKVVGDAHFPNLESGEWRLLDHREKKDGNIKLDFKLYASRRCKIDDSTVARFQQISIGLADS